MWDVLGKFVQFTGIKVCRTTIQPFLCHLLCDVYLLPGGTVGLIPPIVLIWLLGHINLSMLYVKTKLDLISYATTGVKIVFMLLCWHRVVS